MDKSKIEETKEDVKSTEKEAPAAESKKAEETDANKQESRPVVPDGYVPIAAVQEERKKRQERDRALQETQQRLAYLEGQLAEKSKVTSTQNVEAQFDETEFFTKPQKVLKETAEQIAQAKLEAAEKTRFEKKTNFSRNRAMKKYGAEDYLAMEAEFAQRVKSDPTLYDPVTFLDDAAEYVVETVKSWRTEGDASTKLSAAEAEIARLKEQIKNGGAPVKETMPASNAGARGSGATNTSQSKRTSTDSDMLDRMMPGKRKAS